MLPFECIPSSSYHQRMVMATWLTVYFWRPHAGSDMYLLGGLLAPAPRGRSSPSTRFRQSSYKYVSLRLAYLCSSIFFSQRTLLRSSLLPGGSLSSLADFSFFALLAVLSSLQRTSRSSLTWRCSLLTQLYLSINRRFFSIPSNAKRV